MEGDKGRPRFKLTAAMLDVAAQIASEQPLTLRKIAAHVKKRIPDASDLRLNRLFSGLKLPGRASSAPACRSKKTLHRRVRAHQGRPEPDEAGDPRGRYRIAVFDFQVCEHSVRRAQSLPSWSAGW